MKRKTMLRLRNTATVLTLICSLTFLSSIYTTASAQVGLTWLPGTPASINDARITVNNSYTVNCINTDMYTDFSSGSPGDVIQAIAWEEDQGMGTYVCSLAVWDPASNTLTTKEIAQDARKPDVVILDDASSSNPLVVIIGVVYVDVNPTPNEIVYDYITVTDAMSGNTPTISNFGSNNATVSNNSYAADDPHIDAYVDYSTTAFFGGGNTYQKYYNTVMAWTENRSATNEIWVDDGTAGAPNGNNTYIVNGERSDIAAQHEINGSTRTDYAYISYVSGRTGFVGDLEKVKYDIAAQSTVTGTTTQLQPASGFTVNKVPRIDAFNVIDLGYTNSFYDWMAVAELDISGDMKIRAYQPGSSTNLEIDSPYVNTPSSDYQGLRPAIAAGAGPNTYSPSASGEYGNNHYIMGNRIQGYEMYAMEVDLNGNWAGLIDVNKSAINDNGGTREHIAFATSSNGGKGHGVAFENYDPSGSGQYNISFKIQTGLNWGFKPSGLPSMVKENNLTAYPNPARDYVQVTGLAAEASYVVTDLAGRVVKTGTVSTANSNIYVADLTNGMYIFNIKEGNQTHQLKFNKL